MRVPLRVRSTTLPDSRAVDGVALASVITSGVVGLAGVSAAFYSAWRTARTAREGRTEERVAEAYLEVLQHVEREAQRIRSQAGALKSRFLPTRFLQNALGI